MKNAIALPESISPDELLARSIFCGFERKSLKTKIDIDNNIARPSLFIDNRNPWELCKSLGKPLKSLAKPSKS